MISNFGTAASIEMRTDYSHTLRTMSEYDIAVRSKEQWCAAAEAEVQMGFDAMVSSWQSGDVALDLKIFAASDAQVKRFRPILKTKPSNVRYELYMVPVADKYELVKRQQEEEDAEASVN
jgi:hypothetical protein